MQSQGVTYDQSKQKYKENKKTIDKFLVQTIFYEFSEYNDKYSQYLHHVVNLNDESSFYDDLSKLLLEQYSVMKECEDIFIQYIEHFDEYDGEKTDEIKLYYFKVTYFLPLKTDYSLYEFFSGNKKNFIHELISQASS